MFIQLEVEAHFISLPLKMNVRNNVVQAPPARNNFPRHTDEQVSVLNVIVKDNEVFVSSTFILLLHNFFPSSREMICNFEWF